MSRYAEPWMNPAARQVGLCESCGREADPVTGVIRHVATEPMPDVEQLMEWEYDGGCEADDGCWVEPDGICEHGHKSWMLRMGLI